MIGRRWTVRVRVGFVLAASMIGAAAPGCSDGDFVPPPPDLGDAGASREAGPTAAVPRAGTATATSAGPVRRIDFIPSRRMDPDQAAVELAGARTQAGYERARLHILPDDESGTSAGPGHGPRDSSQAELVRASLAGKPSALVVDPDDPADKGLARAVQEARNARVPVVVIARPIAGAGEAKAPGMAPMLLVAPQPFAESARRIVELSSRNLRNARLDPAGGAVILVTIGGDRLIPDRVAALREALAAARITAVTELRISKDLDAAAATLTKQLKDNPKPGMVLFVDYNGSLVSNKVAGDLGEQRPFVQAGYSSDENRARTTMAGNYAALAEYEPTRLIRRAVSVAIAAAQGRESKDREAMAITVLESPPATGLPHVQSKRSSTTEAMQNHKPG